MHQLKLFTVLPFLALPFIVPACTSEFEDCVASRTCPTAGRAGSAGAAGSSAGTPAGGTAGNNGGRAGDVGVSGEGGENASGGTAGSGTSAGGNTGGSAGGGTGGSGASAAAGEGGDSGRGEPTECDEDSTCDDGLFCNGAETCENGRCQDAAAPFTCENPDAVHCRVTCEEGASRANCVVEALDADEDGHTAALCAAAPGDDCDDGNEQIHPNAQEVCDGLDNDCDTRVDLNDGLELAGETKYTVSVNALDLAWMAPPADNSDGPQFRMVIEGPPNSLGSIRLDNSGGFEHGITPIDLPSDYSYRTPRLASGTNTFAIVYQEVARSSGWEAIQIGRDGTQLALEGSPLGASDIARRTSMDWVASGAGTFLSVARYLDSGTSQPGPLLTFGGQQEVYASWSRIAAQGDQSAVVWQTAPNLLRWARLDANLVATDGVSLGATGYRPDIVGAGSGYAVTWAVGSGLGFKRYATDGTMLCDNGLIPLGLDEASDSHRVALADSEYGTLALVTSEVGRVVLVRIDEDCEPLDIIPVANTSTASSPALAVGGGSVALAWIHRANATAYARVAGERLCE